MSAKHISDVRAEYDVANIDELLERLINKYCFGMEIWYDWWVVPAQAVNEIAPGQMQQVMLPIVQVALGCKGVVLGPTGYLWAFVMLDMIPQENLADRAIMNEIQNLRTRRMEQGSLLNGTTGNPQA